MVSLAPGAGPVCSRSQGGGYGLSSCSTCNSRLFSTCSIFEDIGDYVPSTAKMPRDKERERYRERERDRDRERDRERERDRDRERERDRERDREREEEKKRHSYFEKPKADDEVSLFLKDCPT